MVRASTTARATLNLEKQKHKNGLQANLRKTSFAVPHIVDVNWRLDYFMKSSQLEKVNEPRFALQFATQVR